ncbi:class I SAM-dependent methyltransferase [uncultured Thermanaerothrix sp.]|uniref:class I SAM-dependent methyltransferase n=1 Tax=uncultured Thermanaerothrix sp. TaxID=1195149 RepID=UPI002605A35A|nr:class I SAM-dependent methyltransferase [uncultured Thermanaerothrix sp.]
MQNHTETLWHQRFVIQARWSAQVRQHLLNELAPLPIRRILEVGCGTGAILSEPIWSRYTRIGLDIHWAYLKYAQATIPAASLCQGDAHVLPFARASFDLCYTHYLLLWVNAGRVLRECVRVTRPGGFVAALAEPDYGGRIDYPPEFCPLGDYQIRAIQKAGGNPFIGRKLAELFTQAGLIHLRVGILGAYWQYPPNPQEITSGWSLLKMDLQEEIPLESLERWERRDRIAWEQGKRILFVPTFFAWGQVPQNSRENYP